MDELLDLIATDQSAAQVTDKIKDTLYSKAAEKINSQKPSVAMQMFDPTIADAEVEDEAPGTPSSVSDTTEDED
jgi:hypothetical protein|tara:strand:- start:578 stop:799 length:222 start_codon:yes stop_codon:yes gene_type:complete